MHWSQYGKLYRKLFRKSGGSGELSQERRQEVINVSPRYRPMVFDLRMFLHNGPSNPIQSPELMVAQSAPVTEVVRLLCASLSLEYAAELYGLYFHDDTALPLDAAMWDHLDEVHTQGYQDSLVLHMIHKPIKVSFNKDEDSVASLSVDFSQPAKFLHGILCRKYGVSDHSQYVLMYEGQVVDLTKSLLSHDVKEQEHIVLVPDTTATSDEEIEAKISTAPNDESDIGEVDDESKPSIEINSEKGIVEATFKQLVEEITSERNPDDDSDIGEVGDESKPSIETNSDKGIVEATFKQLVEEITSECNPDVEVVKTFLYTYQSFATPEQLMSKLMEIYNVVYLAGMSVTRFAVMKQTIQAKVIDVLKLWVDQRVDFEDNLSLQDGALCFINTVLLPEHPALCKDIKEQIIIIKGGIHAKNLKLYKDLPPVVKIPAHVSASLTIFDFEPEEIARQMTLVDFSLFEKIKPTEFLRQAWHKPKYEHSAQNIVRLFERMDQITLWVATSILSRKNASNRAQMIEYFLSLSQHLLKMHNLNTLVGVVNGLDNLCIVRLKKTFKKLDSVTVKRLKDLHALVSPCNNFRLLRDKIERDGNPCIPYIGLYMSDLTFMDNGNPNFHSDGLINFSKCRLIYNQIRDLILRQSKPYNFEVIPVLQKSLSKLYFLNEDVLYDISLQKESS